MSREMLGATQRVMVGLFPVLLVFALAAAAPRPGRATGPTATLRPTKTTFACKPSTVHAGTSISCATTVADTGSGKKTVPAGVVSFASAGPGVFGTPTCTLAAAGASSASCQVNYVPSKIGTGDHTLKASYAGDDTHAASSGKFELSVTPLNDERRDAKVLGQPPSAVTGTTAGSTSADDDPDTSCAEVDGTVWYALTASVNRRLALKLRAGGRLDAVLGIYRRVRSQFREVGCAPTDDRGLAGVAFEAHKDGHYFVLVGQRYKSAAGFFRLELFAPPVAHPPGTPLAIRGQNSWLDPLTKPEEAWSHEFEAGKTYRINLVAAGGRCMPVSIFAPKTISFRGTEPIRTVDCGGYVVFTPGPDGGGRYSLLIEAAGTRAGKQPYRLQAALAGPDDTAPGLLLPNRQLRRGSLDARKIDVLDLYRFDVAERADVTLRLAAGRLVQFDLVLLSERGRQLGCQCYGGRPKLRTQLSPGHYFAAVRAQRRAHGRYALSLLVRDITATKALISGSANAAALPGQPVTLTAAVTPATSAGGTVRLQVDRFDPIEGWQFFRLFRATVSSTGSAVVTWVPPHVGRWRLHAAYLGTVRASPSESGYASLLVGSSLPGSVPG